MSSLCLYGVILTTVRFAGSVIMAVTYGYDVNDEGDPFISRTNRVIEIATQVMTPERAALLTAFPICACLYESVIYQFNGDLSGVRTVVVTRRAI